MQNILDFDEIQNLNKV